MIIFNHIKLAKKLHSGDVTEREKFYYVMIVIFIISILPSHSDSSSSGRLDYLSDTLTIITLIASYMMNRSGDNHNFVERYFCLQSPLIIQLLIIGVPIMIVLLALLSKIFNVRHTIQSDFTAIGMVFELYYDAALIYAMYVASMGSPQQNTKIVEEQKIETPAPLSGQINPEFEPKVQDIAQD